MPIDPKVLDRVRALLAQAEHPNTGPAEAEAFSAKAAEMIDRYRIARAMLADKDEVVTFGRAQMDLAGHRALRASLSLLVAVAKHYGVVVLTPSTGNSKRPTLAGTAEDIQATSMLFTSLVLQRDRAMLAEPVPFGVATVTFRNSFAYGYAHRIAGRLAALRASQRRDAEAHGSGAALVLFDRKDAVEKWLLDGDLMSKGKTHRNGPRLDGEGVVAGDVAARRADLGGSRVGAGGGALALGSGR